MRVVMTRTLIVSACAGLFACAGCGPHLPEVVPVSGVVTINGEPLPNARITFAPLLDSFGAESNSTAVSDAEGRFQLVCQYNDQPGAVVGQHVVMVTESDLPEKMRAEQDGRIVAKYRAGLGNRPIPPAYASFTQSPLKLEVTPDQAEYELTLTR